MLIIKPETVNDATLISTNVAENDYLLWDILASYSINDTRIYVTTDKHWVIKSLVNGNVGNAPTGLDSDTNWVKVSETNRWKMFDLKTTSQTYNNDSIDVTIAGTGMNNALFLGNMDGTSITVTVKDKFDTTVYTYSGDLIDTSGIYDPYTFFFSPVVKTTDLLLIDLPIYALATYQVVITNTGSVAKCGTMLVGQQASAGNTNYGMQIGITDYSIKSANEFGDFIITERAYSKNISLQSRIVKEAIPSVVNLLNSIRATPVVWVGSSEYPSSYIYGFYRDYNVLVDYPSHSLINIEIEGLS